MEDQHAIEAVIGRYFLGVDRSDPALVRSCFAEDARYTSDAGTLDFRSAEEIAGRIGRGGRFAHTSHVRSSQGIAISGDSATADTFAVAYLVLKPEEGGTVMVRGLQYRDRLARTADGWQIVHRHHSTKWQFDQPGVAPMPV